jgi:HAD superfamily phosphoserine phosphatase-like hydrolase
MKVFIFDFDGTITPEDTTDLILELPGDDRIWEIERAWAAGALTSYQCMKAQARFLQGISIDAVHRHLRQHSHVDKAFFPLLQFLQQEGFSIVLLSEGYDLSIQFHDIPQHIDSIHCSRLGLERGRLTGDLTVRNERTWDYADPCLGCCICKVDFLLRLRKRHPVTTTVAVGDGGSDACLFRYVDVSFSLNPKYEATYHAKDLADVLAVLQNGQGASRTS